MPLEGRGQGGETGCRREASADGPTGRVSVGGRSHFPLRAHRRQCPPTSLLQRRVTGRGWQPRVEGQRVRGWILGIEVKAEGTSDLPHRGAQASRPPSNICSLKGTGTKGNHTTLTVFPIHTSLQVQDLESPGAPLAVMEKSSWKPSSACSSWKPSVPCLLPTVCARAADGNRIGLGLNLTLRRYSRILRFDKQTLGTWHIIMVPISE